MLEKLNILLNTKYKIGFVLILLSHFILTLLELLSIASIPLFVAYIIDPNLLINKIPFESLKTEILKFYEIYPRDNIIFIFSFILFAFFLLKNIFSFLIYFFDAKFNRNIKYHINKNLFKHYLFEDYNFHLNTNPAIIQRNILSATTASATINSVMIFVKECLLLLGLIILLFFSELKTNLYIVLTFLILAIIIFILIAKNIKKKGALNIFLNSQLIKGIHQFLGSIIEIKIKGNEHFFYESYKKDIFKSETILMKLKIVKTLPKIFFELSAVSFLLSLIYLMTKNSNNLIEIIPFATLLTLVIIRAMPSVTNLITASTDIKFQLPYIEIIIKDLKKIKKNRILSKDKKFIKKKFDKSITLKNISFSYNENARNILENISFTIEKGEKICISGKSGSGKSTLINLILGLLKPSSGKIFLDEKELKFNEKIVWENLSYVPQNCYLIDDTIQNNIAFAKKDVDIDLDKIEKILEICALKEFIKSLADGINTKVGDRGIRVSGGQKQRIGIARALFNDPSILFLDEAMSNLDIENENLITKNLKENYSNITIISISHHSQKLENFDKIVSINNGKINEL
jgi:ATP-binding cassette, subfamily B, bacterial PglK